MSRVLVFTLQESGHLNPTFKLSRALIERGHALRYAAIPDLAPALQAQGFETLPWFEDLFPPGSVAAHERLPMLRKRRAITQRFHAVSDALLAGRGGAREIERFAPDLLLVDVNEPVLALFAHARRMRCMLLNTSLPQTRDEGVPPLRSSSGYDPSAAGVQRARGEWDKFLLSRRSSALAAKLLGMGPPYELTRGVAKSFGLPAAQLDCDTVYMPQVRGLRELVLCPAELDFPRAPQPLRTHVASIDLARKEADFDGSKIDAGKPLVYCALGGQRYRPGEVPAFFTRVLAAIAQRPQWQLLLSVGRHHDASALGTPPANALVVQHAPQLAVLKRAQVMITHGGLGSVKECVLHGVPMLVVPLAIDQPGNAARVEHHGIGLRADVGESTVEELVQKLDRLLGEPSFRARVAQLQSRFQAVEHGTAGPDAVAQALALPPP